jgi:hypothetical protein
MGPSQQKLGEKCGLVALFFTGRHHAGENLKRVLKRRSKQLMTRIQMCDGLARNLPGEFETIPANFFGHGRCRFVDVVNNFPEDVCYVLESLTKVYENDALARQENLSPPERLLFHQREGELLMRALHQRLERQLIEPPPRRPTKRWSRWRRNHSDTLLISLQDRTAFPSGWRLRTLAARTRTSLEQSRTAVLRKSTLSVRQRCRPDPSSPLLAPTVCR